MFPKGIVNMTIMESTIFDRAVDDGKVKNQGGAKDNFFHHVDPVI
jgi:hypothetical protein